MPTSNDVTIIIVCAVCGLESPFRGCDRPGCEWRIEYVSQLVLAGTPATIAIAEPTADDRAKRLITGTLTIGGRDAD